MTLIAFYVNFFITLFALIDPIGNVPIFAAATATQTPTARRRLSVYIALFTLMMMTLFFFAGLSILQFFGISMDSFRIAGGLLLFLMGLDMARGHFLDAFNPADGLKHGDIGHGLKDGLKKENPKVFGARESAGISFEKLVVPFAFPLMVGPGTISTVVIQAAAAEKFGVMGYVAGMAAIVTAAIAILLTLLFSNTVSRIFGRVGMVVVIRVLGLILCALSVQIIISAISEITHDVILPSAAHPYPVTSHR